jgi:UDP-2,4-diacetamido-2,4,6-trideoxy-beta-L-altropyranose hydrolase
MTASHSLLVRTDASVAIGTGHVMRCLALAQAWQQAGGNVVFAMAEVTPSLEARLRISRIKVMRLSVTAGSAEDVARTSAAARSEKADWVVVDGYQFDSSYQAALRAEGVKVLFIDDNGEAAPYSADLILNQNAHATEALYRNRETHVRLLLGSRYILLRREFGFWRTRAFEIAPRSRRVLITMGGSDPDNVTEQILRILLAEPDLELTVVVGGSNPHLAELEHLVEHADRPIRLLKDVSDMPALMVWADLAVAGAGTTSWEMCMMGLPAALCVLASNQEKVASELARLGAAVDLGYTNRVPVARTEATLRDLLRSQNKRSTMSQRGRVIVDGRGTERVLALLWGEPTLRRTVESDCRSFWEWANDPEARAASLPREPIPWDRYMEWFRARLADPQTILYTALSRSGDPLGMVRYQLEGSHAILSINVATQSRGKGNGRRVLFLATHQLFENTRTTSIDAFVRPSNEPSVRLFEGAGFRNLGVESVYGDRAIHYVLDKNVLALGESTKSPERQVQARRGAEIHLRRVTDSDCRLLWELANDPSVRGSSFSPEPIPWDQHVAWFRRKLQDENCRVLLALDDSATPIGQIRFDKSGPGEAEIDITIESRFRGLGYASRLIELAANQIFAERELHRLHAFVKPENIASAKAFEKAGFTRLEVATVKGHPAVHFIRTLE